MKTLKSAVLIGLSLITFAGSALAANQKPTNEAQGLRCFPIISPPTCTSL